MVKRRRRNHDDDEWLRAAVGVGIGLLAVYFLKKLAEGNILPEIKTCSYCGHTAEKWARMCSNCRNTFPF